MLSNLPLDLMLDLQRRYALTRFVETGTARGETTVQAARHFRRVDTIEVLQETVDAVRPKFAPFRNIRLHCGDSPTVLRELMATMDEPCLFWIDAHWPGMGLKLGPECPLLDELRAIGGCCGKHVLLCDDARMFLHPPPAPHDPAEWPSIHDIAGMVKQWQPPAQWTLEGDILVITPQGPKEPA